jgi:phosphoenolpyruvate-protein kinase (PTS system EI component)
VRSLSMNASAVPKVKQVIRSVAIDACVRFARRVMEQSDPEQIRTMVDSFGRSDG